MTDQPDVPAPHQGGPAELSEVESIREDLFYGFRSYHTPIKQQRELVERLIEAARLEGRRNRPDAATRREVWSLFHRLWSTARDPDAYDKAAWIRLAELLDECGVDLTSPTHDGSRS